MKKYKQGVAPILLILIIVGILATVEGVYYYQGRINKTQVVLPEKTIQGEVKTKQEDKKVASDITGGKTYTDNVHGFEIKYPNDWRQEACSNLKPLACVGFYPPGKTRRKINDKEGKNFVEYIGDIKIIFAPLRENTITGIEKFYRTFFPEYFKVPQNFRYIEAGKEKALIFYDIKGVLEVDKVAIPLAQRDGYIEIESLSENREILNQIISSFQLVAKKTN